MSTIPVIAKVDVAVVGGTSAAVAVATSAARVGASVFLATPETYLGEDICATGQLWQKPKSTKGSELLPRLFPRGVRLPLRPMAVKTTLDKALLDAGVVFRFLSCPSDLLVDTKGRLAGVVFATKSGAYAVEAKRVVDATATARLARALGLPFTEWEGGSTEFRAVVIGAPAADSSGLRIVERGLVPAPADEKDKTPLPAFEYAMDATLETWDAPSVARVENEFRSRIWSRDQVWRSNRCFYLPGTRLEGCSGWDTDIPGFLVVGPCAAIDEKTARSLLAAETGVRIGEKVGAEIGTTARKAHGPAGAVSPMYPAEAAMARRLREPCTDSRALRESVNTVQGVVDAADLPVLAEVDVLVVGGGTGGAPAAIAAARAGAKTLCLESLHDLGGVATVGAISHYYYGYREGFTNECINGQAAIRGDWNFPQHASNPFWKSEWLRKELLAAGGELWFDATVSGAVVDSGRVEGAIVNIAWGRGIVLAKTTIDATGNCDVVALAGGKTRQAYEDDLAFQGAGMPSRPFRPAYRNTDYTFILDSDIADLTRIFTVGRRKFADAFDMGEISDTRERRQIVGDVTLQPTDVYLDTRWPDAVCRCHSNFDTHGFTVYPLFLVLPPDRRALDAWLPMRALTPKGLTGIAVTGLAVSAQRDVMPVLRMQPEVQNQAYSLGTAAAWAVKAGHNDFRRTDFTRLQRAMVEYRANLPERILLDAIDEPDLPADVVDTVLEGPLSTHTEASIAYTHPKETVAALSKNVHDADEPADVRRRRALMLAILGSKAGERELLAALRDAPAWDEGWNYRGMGQYCRSLSPLDDVLVCLGRISSAKAAPDALRLAATITTDTELSHIRALALYAEGVAKNAKLRPLLAKELSRLLASFEPIHVWETLPDELADIPESSTDTLTRNVSLKELFLARALYRLGDDSKKSASKALRAYAFDIRGQFAAAAAAILL